MSRAECTEEEFLRHVADHKMKVLRDDGVYRHLRFNGERVEWNRWFALITYPWGLTYTGDMGTFVFSRLEDMFDFFRRKDAKAELYINPGYWAEKLLATDKSDGHEGYSPERFRRVVCERRMEWIREAKQDGLLNKEQRRELWEAIDEEVLSAADSTEGEARSAADDFRHEIGRHTYEFTDFFDHDLTAYTYRFLWACYAIAWGIRQYDAAKADEAAKKGSANG